MRELQIGEMAESNCVSIRTLRVYHEQGLLIPIRVDPQTGYRYYSLDQCATLDMIQQLKTLGLSLEQIRTVLKKRDVGYLAALMREQISLLDAEARRLAISREIAANLLGNCDVYEQRPACDIIAIEKLPERRIVRIPIRDFTIDDAAEAAKTVLETWELDLRQVKHEFLRRGYPMSLFRKVGCLISKDNLARGQLHFEEAFVFVDAACADVYESAEVVAAGPFLTMYCDRMIDEHGEYKETVALRALLRHIDAEGYRITGDYLGEIIAETPAFLYEGRDMMFKLQIPIDAPDGSRDTLG